MIQPSEDAGAPFDVLGIGCVAVDDFLYVSEYPVADSKVMATRGERRCGGLAGGMLQAAARLGARCGYAATLGDDELSRFVIDRLRAEYISLQYLRRQPGVQPIHCTVVVDTTQQTRTIFFSLDGAQGAQADWPPEEAITSSKVLFVDHYGIEGMIRAAEIARAAGIPVVADFESNEWPGFEHLLSLVDHLILSGSFACKLAQESEPARACMSLRGGRSKTTVVVTCGSSGCWYCSDTTPGVVHHPAFLVEVLDSTGCGDAFHGAYARCLARDLSLEDRVRFASAAGALKAKTSRFPTLEDVEAFLRNDS